MKVIETFLQTGATGTVVAVTIEDETAYEAVTINVANGPSFEVKPDDMPRLVEALQIVATRIKRNR